MSAQFRSLPFLTVRSQTYQSSKLNGNTHRVSPAFSIGLPAVFFPIRGLVSGLFEELGNGVVLERP